VLGKVVIVSGGSKNALVWGRSRLRRCGDIYRFVFLKYAFLIIFWFKFLLKKRVFKILQNVC